ncbi:MAG TPA: InlB B-repeat-containing protein [Tetrasphaera sp.]|uniref:InlB B-repeat-containing protein n=1 Tax=Nostocoides sp. TaxID=1917966 RepID=UPI002C1AC394|nr:InlB B-repeat-containing protein [Tetrasphaera sp.]HNQ07431.1 InlB B-repeat-containing protein [Tetrasphaera sp.]
MKRFVSRRPSTIALAGAVVAALLATAVPPAAQADDGAYQPYGSAALLSVGSHQYYDVYGTQARDISEPSTFLRQVLTTPVPGAGANSLATLWGDLARTIYFSAKSREDSGWLAGDGATGTMPWVSGPVTEAASLAAADQQIRSSLALPAGLGTNSDLTGNTATQSVFYQLKSAKGSLGGKVGIAVIYYDFKLGYLNAGGQMTSAAPGPDNKVTTGAADVSYSGGVQNASSVPVQASQSLQQSTAQEIVNSVTSTEQYSHTQAIEYTTELTTPLSGLIGGGKETIKLALNATELFGQSTTNSTTSSTSTSATGAVSMALPPHTGALISQSTTKSTFLAKYDYPVALQYQVKVVGYYQYQVNVLDQTLTTFGENPAGAAYAADNLQARYQNRNVAGYEATHGSGLDWAAIDRTGTRATAESEVNFRKLFGDTMTYNYTQMMDRLISVRPMSLTGGVLSGTSTTIASNVAAITPLYPLERVSTTQQRAITLTPDDQLFTDDLPLRGLNRYYVDYYGFNPVRGHWIVLDATGAPAPTSPVAQLRTNPITGTTTLDAGGTPGTVYLKYLIEDGLYTSGDQSGPATTNADLVSTAVVPVTVTLKPFVGSIAVTGALTGYVGDPELTISGPLTPVLSDTTGLQVDRPVTWQAQELPSFGIKVVDNKVTFTVAGTFHVRAVVDGVYSPWIAVTARPKRKLASIVIADPLKVLTVTLTKGGSATVDLTKLPVVAKDQYKQPFPLRTSAWIPSGAGLNVRGRVLTVTAAGSYALALKSGTVLSNSLPVRATLLRRQLRFNTGGGQVLAPRTYADGRVIDLGNFSTARSGYTFTGWYTDASLTTRVAKFAITADTTVYAGWR